MDVKRQQTITGIVERIRTPHTIRVMTKVTKIHPLYRKRFTQLRRYLAHDPEGTAKVGEEVIIGVCRPISKSKHWTLLKK